MKFFKNKFFVAFVVFLLPLIFWIWTYIMKWKYGWSTGTTDGWLGFLGTYFGAIIGICGVYWSVIKTNDIEEERLKLQERPTILVNRYEGIYEEFFYFSFNKEEENIEEREQGIKKVFENYGLPFMVFRNCSSKNAINCLIHIKYKNSAEDYFLVENIKPFSEVKILRSDAYYDGLKKINDKNYKDLGGIIDINLKYLTESNEVVEVKYRLSEKWFVPNKPEYIKDYDYLYKYYSCPYITGYYGKN